MNVKFTRHKLLMRLITAVLCVGMLIGNMPVSVLAADTGSTGIVLDDTSDTSAPDSTEEAGGQNVEADSTESIPATDTSEEADTGLDAAFESDADSAESAIEKEEVSEKPDTESSEDADESTADTKEDTDKTDAVSTEEKSEDENTAETETVESETAESESTETVPEETETTAQDGAAAASVTEETHYIATYAGQIPQVDGVTWADGVTEDTFSTAYSTVTIKDTDGSDWQVEIVPEGLVYFIDCNLPGSTEDTVPYASVKALAGEGLLNQTNDQFKTDDNAWGLLDTDAGQKGTNGLDVTDKTVTGVYAKDNKAGETLSYALTLEPGIYTLTTAHREWWGSQNRAMDLSLTTAAGTATYASVPKQDNGASTVKEYTFTLTSAQTVTFTATATGSHAPAVSWLAVARIGDADEVIYTDPLEDNDGLTLNNTQPGNNTKTSVALTDMSEAGLDKVLEISGNAWNDKNGGCAVINNGQSMFGSTAFTLLADVKFTGTSEQKDKAAAFSIGNKDNCLHILTYSGKLGYGTVTGGLSAANIELANVSEDGWNAIAVVYEEKDGGNGSVKMYINGQLAGQADDIGFKLSEMSDITGYIGRTFNTSYLANGLYDNIVVGNTAMSEEEAIAETAARKEAKDPAEAPVKPTLPEGFTEPLEDNDRMTLADGTVTEQVSGMDTVIDVATQWNNAGAYHASITEAQDFFKTTAFTVLFDVRQDPPSGDTHVLEQRAALSIGDTGSCLHILTYTGKLGYGANPSGISTNTVELAGVEKNGWNAVAVTYEEKDGGNGSVIVYVNGQKAGEVADIGFKLSEMEDLTAMIARSFNTNYLQEGRYDNIVVGNSVLDEATAIAETAYRKYAKDNPGANTLPLEACVAQAEALIEAGLTSEELESALAAAKELLASELTIADQAAIDAAAKRLRTEIDKLNPTEVTIIGSDVEAAAENINGLTWKGFGMLNGNSTSNLLLDYKAENPDAYWAMMEYLFGGTNPLFTHIKMEMGNDGNNSTGAEACTMRYEDEEADASRSPGFVMAADAKKINPDVKISILRWEMPAWVAAYWNSDKTGKGYEAVYTWYKETIFDAYEKYGYVIDFINPDKNETGDPDEDFIKWFANRLENETEFPSYFTDEAKEAYKNIRIIASDENKGLQIVPSMRSDAELYDAVDIIGFHYRTDATDDYVAMADVDDKEVWYSEGCATFGYTELQENKTTEYGAGTIGGYQSPLALMDSFIVAFDTSRRTHYVFQPAIGSFYEGIQYGHKELLSARDPWSGYIHYDPALYMLQHFTNFAVTGWEDTDPAQNEIWRVISSATEGGFAGSSNEHNTAGIDGNASYMTLAAPDKKNFSTVFVNNTQNEKTFLIRAEGLEIEENTKLEVWTTVTDSYLQHTGTVEATENGWYISVPAYSVVTATTLTDVEVLRFPTEDGTGDYIQNDNRAVLDTDETGRGVNTEDTVLYADDFEYAEEADMEQYNVSTGTTTKKDYLTARGSEPRYMLDTHGAWIVENGRLKQALSQSVAQWNGGEPSTIVGDFRWMDYAASLDVQIPDLSSASWMRLGIRCQTGMNWNNSGYTLAINGAGSWELYRIGTKVDSGSVTASEDGSYSLKLIALDNTIAAVIDGEIVCTYQDSTPILSGRVKISSTWTEVYADNLLVETVDGGIPYATAMIDGQDDSVTYEGGWTINNPGGGSADNWYRTVSVNTEAGASFSFPIDGAGFAIIGANGGNAVLDIYVDGTLVEEGAATAASVTRGETYVLSDLENGAHNIKVVVTSGTLTIDAIHTLGERLDSGDLEAVRAITTELPQVIAVTTAGNLPDSLPDAVEVLMTDGTAAVKSVTWSLPEDVAEKAYDTVSVKGTLKDAVNVFGMEYTLSVSAEVVPEGTVYFIDTVEANMSVSATEPFDAVKALLGDQLLNEASDQYKTADNTWGLVDTDAGTKGYTGTADKTATGIYGHDNAAGETLTYQLTLPAGVYTLTSAHREWWNQTRPMTATVTADGNVVCTAALPLTGSSGDLINEATFVLEKETVVDYTITATGSQAPVISWLAVAAENSDELIAELKALIETTNQNLAADAAAGVNYAETPLEPGQYTGAGEAPKDSLQDMNEALDAANALLKKNDPSASELLQSIQALTEIYASLRIMPEAYTSIPGTDGDVIYASNTGLAMQAHGGSAMAMKEGAGEGCVNFDLDGDGEITEGKTVYLWYGENKTNNTRPVDGVRLYVSTDLYNWTDRGNVLYLQNAILPIEISEEAAVVSQTGASGVGTTQDYNTLQLSETNLETLKAWGKLEKAPEGVSEEDFGNVKLFLRAYVTEFEKEPAGLYDTTWVAKSYDESTITASSLLYPDSTEESVRTVTTTPLQLAFETLYGDYCITERPKVVYNESIGKFVMIFHADGPLYNNETLNKWVAGGCEGTMSASRYSRAMVGFAESDTPFGPFELVNVTRMNYDADLNANRLGESRDMTVFVDYGVDKNNDGVDDAYVIYSSEMNAKLYVSMLNTEYTAPIAEGEDAEWGENAASRILTDNSREAPAVFKYDGYYYMITSGTDGWNSTAHIYYRSTDMLSGWEKVGNPALNDTGKCFNTQVTWVLPVDAENGTFIYMGDRWNGSNLTDSRTVWLPVQMNSNNTLSVIGYNDWTLEDLYRLAPITIYTELPEIVYADGSNLPDTLRVSYMGQTVETAVEWTVTTIGETTITATLTDCDNVQTQVSAFVSPKNLVYLVNPSAVPLSADYDKIRKLNEETLLSQENDGAYSEETGFGYTGAEGKLRGANADIYESLRYAVSGNSITYQFDLEAGSYKVYVGMFDPSGWYNGRRYADVKINGVTETSGYNYKNNINETLTYETVLTEDGSLTVEIAKNSASTNDVQVSFLMVEKVHEHTWSEEWSFDETAHWHACTDESCELVSNKKKDGYAEHVYDDDMDEICNICGYEREIRTQLNVEEGISEVPEGLLNTAYNTVEKIGEKLISQLTVEEGYVAEQTAIYDVTLLISMDNGKTWQAADEEHFPAEGITVTLPYPNGTNKEEYEFTVSHMFTVTSMRLGTIAGGVETFSGNAVVKTEAGIQVTLKGLSPVAVAWKLIDQGGEEDPDPTPTPGPDTHTHSWSSGWSMNSAAHWHNCNASGCDITQNSDKSGYGAHVYDNDKDATCNVCGYVRSVAANDNAGDSEDSDDHDSTPASPTGAVETTQTDTAPKTGDNSHALLWVLLLTAAAAMLAEIWKLRRRNDK